MPEVLPDEPAAFLMVVGRVKRSCRPAPLLVRLRFAVVAVGPGVMGAVARWPVATLGMVPGATAARAAGRPGATAGSGGRARGLTGPGLRPARVNNQELTGRRVCEA